MKSNKTSKENKKRKDTQLNPMAPNGPQLNPIISNETQQNTIKPKETQ